MGKTELLAPAGNPDKLRTVIDAGADAVYAAGEQFSLRAQSDNFSMEELIKSIDYVKEKEKKIYIPVNIFARNEHIEKIKDFLKEMDRIRPHALIISDPGVYALRNEYCPEIDVHWSTQANTTNYQSVRYLFQQGIKRFNIARECSFEELKEIKENNREAEIEIFVHGAMCVAYSGRCLLSAVLCGRSSNLGLCAHPCRWNFYLKEESREEEKFPIVEDEYGTYILNSKDLCLIEEILMLMDIGIDSLKIEGRMKSLNYAATVVSVYREAIDSAADKEYYQKKLPEWIKRLNTSDHRGFTKGFFYQQKALDVQNYSNIKYHRIYQTAGIVRKIYQKELILIEVKNRVFQGDILEIQDKNGNWIEYELKVIKDIFLQPLNQAHPNDFVLVPYTKRLPIHGIIRKKTV